MKKTFTRQYHSLMACGEINLHEVTVLSLIISYHENGNKVFMTNRQFEEQLHSKVKLNTIKKIIPALNRNGFITVQNFNKKNPEYKSWSNNRIITVTQKTMDIIESEIKKEAIERPISVVIEDEPSMVEELIPVVEQPVIQLTENEEDKFDKMMAEIALELEPIETLDMELTDNDLGDDIVSSQESNESILIPVNEESLKIEEMIKLLREKYQPTKRFNDSIEYCNDEYNNSNKKICYKTFKEKINNFHHNYVEKELI